MMKHKKLKHPVYNFECVVFWGGNYEEFNSITGNLFPQGTKRSQTNAMYFVENRWLWLPKKCSIALLVHEVFHVVTDMLTSSGVSLNDSSEETFAYELQWWVNKIGKVIGGKKSL